MRKLLDFCSKRIASDSGDSEVISVILFMPLLVSLIMTTIDVGQYFIDRTLIQNVARDAARTVAIYGGAGTATHGTPIENTYGVKRHELMAAADALSRAPVTDSAYKLQLSNRGHSTGSKNRNYDGATDYSQLNNVELGIIDKLAKSTGIQAVSIYGVKCRPTVAKKVNDNMTCEIYWDYFPQGFSLFNFVRYNKSDGYNIKALGDNITTGTSQSEIGWGTNSNAVLQPRK